MIPFPRNRFAPLLLASAVALGPVAGCAKQPADPGTAPNPRKAGTTGRPGGTAPTSPGTTAPAAGPLAVTADQLAKDFQTDEKAAQAKYKEKELVVDGLFKEAYERNVGGTANRRFYFADYSDPATKHTCMVVCKVEPGPWPAFDGLTPGQKVKIKARCTGGNSQSVSLADGEVVEAGLDPAVVVTAAQLAKEFAANKQAAGGKYNDKWLLVEGTVFETNPKDKPTITLEGADEKAAKPVRVVARFLSDREADPGKVKKGDKVKLKGKAALYFDDSAAVLDDCKLVK